MIFLTNIKFFYEKQSLKVYSENNKLKLNTNSFVNGIGVLYNCSTTKTNFSIIHKNVKQSISVHFFDTIEVLIF